MRQKMASLSRLSDSLQRFRLDGVRDTDITVGDGAYATVLQYDFRGLKCVGKKIHRLLYDHASPAQKADMLQRFARECELLGRLHHPNIVQFLGIHVETGSELPVLLMEYLPTNLSGYLDRHGVLPIEIGCSILRDVALGLHYLHEYSPLIVHRDLSANNILLTASLSAKISDLGVAKIINISPSQTTQQMSTKVPGTPCYMPPEALIAQPRYTQKIDNYSFGVMILHVLCGEWPFPTDAFQCDSQNPDVFVPITEVDRRAHFLHQMGRNHPLSELVCQCLSNAPNQRPDSADILRQIDTVLSQVPAPAENVFQQLQRLMSENQRQASEIQRLENKTLRLSNENQSIRTDQKSMASGVKFRDWRLRARDWVITTEVQDLRSEIQRLEIENLKMDNENQSLMSKVQSLRRENQTLRKHSQTQPSSSGAAVNQPPSCEFERLSVRVLCSPVKAAKNSTESQLHPGVRLQWRRCADAPVGMIRAQVTVIGEKVYVGGGWSTSSDDDSKVFQYNRREDTWSTLPPCPVKHFSMAYFMGRIITVGGWKFSPTNKVHSPREESQQWEEFLTPMPTARCHLSVVTTTASIGGVSIDIVESSAVEVYSSDTSLWYTADPLPKPCAWMSSVTIKGIWYLLGGRNQANSSVNDCWCVPLDSIVHKAVSCPASGSVWSHLPPTPLKASTAACLSGSLVAIGGRNDDKTKSCAVNGFLKSSWVRLNSGDQLFPQSSCATAQLSPVEVIIIGGRDQQNRSKTVFIGTLHL